MDLSAMLIELNKRCAAIPNARLYLLLDPYLHEGVIPGIVESRQQAVVRLLERPKVPASKRPVVMAFRTETFDGDERLLQKSLEQAIAETSMDVEFSGRGRLFGGWLISTQPPLVIAEHLRTMMDQREPSFDLRYIRLGDPRVTTILWSHLKPAEQAALLGPIEAWFVFDHRGVGCCLSRPSEMIPAEPWQATPEQWPFLMERMALINGLMLTLRRDGRGALADHARIDSLIRLAKQQSFSHREDIRTHVLYALRYGEACLRHPKVLGWQTQALKEQRLLDDVFADGASPQEWETIADEAARIATTRKEGASLYG